MDADLRDLLAAWLGDEDPGEDRRQELLKRLRDDHGFRAAFVGEIQLLGMLKAVQAPEPRWLRLADELGWSGEAQAPIQGLEKRIMLRIRKQAARRGHFWTGIAVAASIALVVIGVIYSQRAPDLPTPQLAQSQVTPAGRTPPTPMELASVLSIEGIEWSDPDGDRVVKAGAVTAGRLRFQGGTLQLQFASGVVLTMEGTVDVEILASDRVFCHRGKLRARVPPGAEGFAILAPGYEVVDLGTEFALNQEPGKQGEVMVLEGEAAVSILDSQGRTRRSALVQGPRTVAVDPQNARIAPTWMSRNRFASLPDSRAAGFSLSADYAREVLESQPWGYWRFESQRDNLVPNEIDGRPALRLLGGVGLEVTAKDNHCVRFLPELPGQAVLMDGTWTPPRATAYAFEVWMQAESQGQSAVISLIADEREELPERHLALLEMTARGQQSPQDRCAFRFLDRWPAGEIGGMNLFSRRQYLAGRWHHIVCQKSGDTLELYIDGELVGSSSFGDLGPEPLQGTVPCQLLLGCLKLHPSSLVPHQTRYFFGRLDELALYERALGPDEIRQHYQWRARAE